VLAVPSKGVVVLNLGAKHGFKAGDKLKLYETVDLKDDKGAVVFTEEKLVEDLVRPWLLPAVYSRLRKIPWAYLRPAYLRPG